MSVSECVVFNGITFRRYPDSERTSDRVYFTPTPFYRQRGVGRLHQEIWKAANGPIPDGWHVHHVDHNPLNNQLENLECKPGRKHIGDHGREREPDLDLLARIRPMTVAWHRSEAGREWHRQHGFESWVGRAPHEVTCQHCGKRYETRAAHGNERFCSNNCKMKARKASGVDDVDRICRGCSATFRINKYSSTQSCSRKCAWVVRRSA